MYYGTYILVLRIYCTVSNTMFNQIQLGLVLRRGYVLEYLGVTRVVVKRVLFKWFKLDRFMGQTN